MEMVILIIPGLLSRNWIPICYSISSLCASNLISLGFRRRFQSHVFWTVHHCDSWRTKDQLDVTCYFISLLMRPTCFGHISIIRSLRLFCWITTMVVCSWFDVCWCFGVVGLAWYPCSACNTDTTPTQQHQHTSNQEQYDQCGNSTE